MAYFSLIAACPLEIDQENLLAPDATTERDLETLLLYARGGVAASGSPLDSLRVSVESWGDSIESVTVKTMSLPVESPEEIRAWLAELEAALPAYFPEILRAYSHGCRFITFDINLDEWDSWQAAAQDGRVSAHERVAVRRAAEQFLIADAGFADSPKDIPSLLPPASRLP